MAVSTRTYIGAVQDVADSLQLRESGAFTTTPSTSSLISAAYPYKTNRTDANNKTYEGAEIYATSGTVPVPNPNGIGSYVASTGEFVPSLTYSTKPDATASFDIYLRGVGIAQIRRAINRALRQHTYKTISPLTLVTDGDQQTSGTTSWTATNATLSKVATAGNLILGTQSLRVLATSALGQAQSGTITADPTYQSSYSLGAFVRAAVGTARLIAYDVTNSAVIDYRDWTAQGWGYLSFNFSLPATCESVAVVLRSVANSDDAYWGPVILFREGADYFPLPDWVTEPRQVFDIYKLGDEGYPFDKSLLPLSRTSEIRLVEDQSNPLSAVSLRLSHGMSQPYFIKARRPFAELSADTDTTFMDRSLLTLAASVELLGELKNRPSSAFTAQWLQEYETRLRKLNKRDRQRVLDEASLDYSITEDTAVSWYGDPALRQTSSWGL